MCINLLKLVGKEEMWQSVNIYNTKDLLTSKTQGDSNIKKQLLGSQENQSDGPSRSVFAKD